MNTFVATVTAYCAMELVLRIIFLGTGLEPPERTTASLATGAVICLITVVWGVALLSK